MSGIRYRRDVEGLPLSGRERDCLRAYARAGDLRETAAALGLSYHTVKNHLSAAYAKLGAKGAIDAFRLLGWLEVRP